MKRCLGPFLCALIILALFAGCRPEKPEQKEKTLRVLTDATECYGTELFPSELADSIGNVLAYWQESHPDVKTSLEVLPEETEERKAALQKLRTEIMAGQGPDVFLLPSGSTISLPKPDFAWLDPLFQNVEQPMRNRLFLDLTEYFNNDKELDCAGLNDQILEGGVVDGKRYVLPLGYNMPVLYVDTDRARELGLDIEKLSDLNLYELYDAVYETKDAASMWGVTQGPLNMKFSLFPNLFDYDGEKVLLTAEELEHYFEKRAPLLEVQKDYRPGSWTIHLFNFLSGDTEFVLNGKNACYIGELSMAAELLGIGKGTGMNLSAIPLRSADGSVIADITYWGAINANCECPEEAYSFLRLFLQEEVQLQKGFGEDYSTVCNKLRQGWPVLSANSGEMMWRMALRRSTGVQNSPELRTPIAAISFDDSDVEALLSAEIDEVRFANPIEHEAIRLFDDVEDRQEKTAEEVAEYLVTQLNYQLAES